MKNLIIVVGALLSVAAAVAILLTKKHFDESYSDYDRHHF